MTSASKPELYYWDFRAIGEPVRLLLRYLEVDFVDHRIPMGETNRENVLPSMMEPWLNQKYTHGLDFPNLPFYVDENGVKLTQTLAIMRYIGKTHNLGEITPQEEAVADMVAQTVMDKRWEAWLVYSSTKFPEIKDEWKAGLPERLAEVNKFLEGKEFVLGDKISYADFVVYEITEWFRQFAPEVFEESPELQNLNNFQKRIEALPKIKAYMESEDFKSWPFWAPFVHWGHSKNPDFQPMPVSFINFTAKYPLEK